MTEEQMQVSKEELEKWKKEQIKLAMQISKEEYEKRTNKIRNAKSNLVIKFPEEIKDSDEFLNLIKEKLKDYNGYSQECEGTFKIKDGNVTDINITGIAFIPRFRDKDTNK